MKDTKQQEFLKLLHEIKNTPHSIDLIRKFQYEIWNMEETDDVDEILIELAYELDYYEPNPIIRLEDPSYYGEEKLFKEID